LEAALATPETTHITTVSCTHPQALNEHEGKVIYRDDVPWQNIVDIHKALQESGTGLHLTGQSAEHDSGRVARIIDGDIIDPSCAFAMGIYQMAPNSVHPLHLHTHAAEFYYVLAGEGKFTIGDDTFDGRPGLSTYMPIGMPHAVENTGSSDLDVLYCFSPSDLASIGTTWLDQ
jgi:mannose-6-phosphate isomerase-like protein (cupin superfamily)